MKILHLIIDHQVIERTLSIYETVFPNSNTTLIFGNKPFKHLNRHASCRIINYKNLNAFRKSFNYSEFDYIIAHYLTWEMIDFIESAPKSIHIQWEIYGFDLYNQFLAHFGYKVSSIDSVKYDNPKVRVLKKFGIYGFLNYIKTGYKMDIPFLCKKYFSKITSRLNSIAVGCSADALLLEQYSGKTFITCRAFNYSLKETLGDLYDSPFHDGSSILIGNSASFSNNHFYILNYLKHLCKKDVSLIIPISYGGNSNYVFDVINSYEKSFPNCVTFIKNYIPLHEYNKLFLNICTMILASWRQESIGTIIMGLYLGIKIYMSERSPLYSSLKDEGFILFTLENSDNKSFNTPLTVNQKNHNRNLLLKLYNEESIETELRKHFL